MENHTLHTQFLTLHSFYDDAELVYALRTHFLKNKQCHSGNLYTALGALLSAGGRIYLLVLFLSGLVEPLF